MKNPTHAPLYIAASCIMLTAIACEQAPAPAPTPAKQAPPATAPAPTTSVPATPAAAPPAPTTSADAPATLTAAGVSFSLPKGWKQVPPANAMRLAEVHVADPSGDASKLSTITFSSAGGDVAANTARWAAQMKDASGQAPKVNLTERTIGGMRVSSVEFVGSYAGMGEAAPRPDWMLRGAVVDAPTGLLFVKMTGPAGPMSAAASGWDELLSSIRKP